MVRVCVESGTKSTGDQSELIDLQNVEKITFSKKRNFEKPLLVKARTSIDYTMATHSESLILQFAAEILNKQINPKVHHHLRMFKCYFGVSPFIAGCILDRLNDQHLCFRSASDVRHLLWALLFLKVYSFEEVLARLVGYTPKTYRQHVWSMLKNLAALSVVSTIQYEYVGDGRRRPSPLLLALKHLPLFSTSCRYSGRTDISIAMDLDA